MKIPITQELEIPSGVEVVIDGNFITVKGSEGEVKKEFNLNKIDVIKKDNKLILECKKATKTEKKIINTNVAHIKNMIKGVIEKFTYELKICFSHFPFTVKIEGDKAIIKNFLGEKIERSAKIIPGVEVKINKEIIEVVSVNKELAGQTAANLETATKIRNRDQRVFQDGIYIIKKDGKEI